MAMERLHKFLASAGVASRRRCEELIVDGHVSVDGLEVRALGTLVDPELQEICFNGERIRKEPPAYYLCYKPVGYLCTNRDEYGRPTVVSLVRDRLARRLFTVGRLDEDSEGLILVTNDGDFANKVAHPRFGLQKTYALKLHGDISNDNVDRARKGVWLAEGRTGSLHVRVQKRSKQFSYVTVKVGEGRNRMLRRIFAKLGHNVAKLKRVRIGSLGVKGISRGQARTLSKSEIEGLLAECDENRNQGAAPSEASARRQKSRDLGHAVGKPEHRPRRRSKRGSSRSGGRSQSRAPSRGSRGKSGGGKSRRSR